MRKLSYFLIFIAITSCGTGKKGKLTSKERRISVAAADNVRRGNETPVEKATTATRSTYGHPSKADGIINTALTFSGVRYRFGGTTRKGMDCSGLLYVSFAEHDIKLPRTSIHMSEEGKKIRIKDVEKGDLLFFKTNRRAKRINHVGLVVKVDQNEIKFIHASSSRGVIVSSLREGFWNHAFVKATRIL